MLTDTECFQQALKQWHQEHMFDWKPEDELIAFEDLSPFAQSEVLQLAQKIKDGQHETEAKKTGN